MWGSGSGGIIVGLAKQELIQGRFYAKVSPWKLFKQASQWFD